MAKAHAAATVSYTHLDVYKRQAQSNAAVGPLRSTDGALTSVAGALLTPRLLAATGNLRAALSGLGALTRCV